MQRKRCLVTTLCQHCSGAMKKTRTGAEGSLKASPGREILYLSGLFDFKRVEICFPKNGLTGDF